ncbi:hypothetical protein, partial [Achromobacter dolens]|uniref:hypothetical protein n=1 Tax=Achromobacter dolens TaxID=1287738 RepID=UPI003B9EA3B0
IPKTTDIGRAAEGQLLASFNGFAEGLQAMLGALDRGGQRRIPEPEEHQDRRGQRRVFQAVDRIRDRDHHL